MSVEVQDIFQAHGPEYLQQHNVSYEQYKVMMSIMNCRTATLGGRVEQCPECKYTAVLYNSCGNRHCPKCQTLPKERWIDARQEDLLPVAYFHVVFTIPEEINPIMFQNQKELYRIFFAAVARTLAELTADPKYLGAQIGFTAILHTWGQNMMYHPHIHYVIPNAGLTEQGTFRKGGKDFFLPVKVVSRKFRGKFLHMLNQAAQCGDLQFHGSAQHLRDKSQFCQLRDSLYRREWVVYTKRAFTGPVAVIEYLGRYTHRVAISNNRILKLEDGQVTFKWKDYRDNQEKVMTISAEEFIRRFLMHVLPYRFMKIRHYGLQANRNRNTKLRVCQRLAGYILSQAKFRGLCAVEIIELLTGTDVTLCPCCKTVKMVLKQTLPPRGNAPPLTA